MSKLSPSSMLLNEIISKVQSSIKYDDYLEYTINRGGCGLFALKLYNALLPFKGYMYRDIVITAVHRYGDTYSCHKKWLEGIPDSPSAPYHVMVAILTHEGHVLAVDGEHTEDVSLSSKLIRKFEDNFRFHSSEWGCKFYILSRELLITLLKYGEWNPAFWNAHKLATHTRAINTIFKTNFSTNTI